MIDKLIGFFARGIGAKIGIVALLALLAGTNLWTHQATKTAERNAYNAKEFFDLNDSLLSKEKAEKALYIISEKYEKEKANIKNVDQALKAKAVHHAKTIPNFRCFTESQLRNVNAAAHNRVPADPSKPIKSADYGFTGNKYLESRYRANNDREIESILSELT